MSDMVLVHVVFARPQYIETGGVNHLPTFESSDATLISPPPFFWRVRATLLTRTAAASADWPLDSW